MFLRDRVNGKRSLFKLWVRETPVVAAAGAAAKPRTPRRAGSSGGGAAVGSGQVEVPMQGTIVKILVEVGQSVEAGDAVLVLEAMKMEHTVTAPTAGTVTEIDVEAGAQVAAGEVLAIVEEQ
jgi:acetyl-CoA/propionyl-CoA carboxylase, biotin carboxylase, biotin carboxyl carrier protein